MTVFLVTLSLFLQFTSSLLNKSEEQKDESPSSWRLSLRKTSSQNMLNEGTTSRDTLKDKGGPIYRSSSTPRISALLDNKEKVQMQSNTVSHSLKRVTSNLGQYWLFPDILKWTFPIVL